MAKTYEKNLRAVTALQALSPDTVFHVGREHVYFECRAKDALETLRVLLAETGVTFQPAKAARPDATEDSLLRYELHEYDAQALLEHAREQSRAVHRIKGGAVLTGNVAAAPVEHIGSVKGL